MNSIYDQWNCLGKSVSKGRSGQYTILVMNFHITCTCSCLLCQLGFAFNDFYGTAIQHRPYRGEDKFESKLHKEILYQTFTKHIESWTWWMWWHGCESLVSLRSLQHVRKSNLHCHCCNQRGLQRSKTNSLTLETIHIFKCEEWISLCNNGEGVPSKGLNY